jgi:hypothetical protein
MSFYVCKEPGCRQHFTAVRHLNNHVSVIHRLERNYVCDIASCAQRFAYRNQLAVHKRDAHASPEKPWRCARRGCSAAFATEASLNEHKQSRHMQGKGQLPAAQPLATPMLLLSPRIERRGGVGDNELAPPALPLPAISHVLSYGYEPSSPASSEAAVHDVGLDSPAIGWSHAAGRDALSLIHLPPQPARVTPSAPRLPPSSAAASRACQVQGKRPLSSTGLSTSYPPLTMMPSAELTTMTMSSAKTMRPALHEPAWLRGYLASSNALKRAHDDATLACAKQMVAMGTGGADDPAGSGMTTPRADDPLSCADGSYRGSAYCGRGATGRHGLFADQQLPQSHPPSGSCVMVLMTSCAVPASHYRLLQRRMPQQPLLGYY